MWTPGIFAGALVMMVVGELTGSYRHPWWIIFSIVLALGINQWLGYEQKRVPKVKETTEWKDKKDKGVQP